MNASFATVLWIAAASPAIATDDSGATARAQAALAGLPPADAAPLVAVLDRASAQRLPQGPIAEKILEGLAKHVEPIQVATAASEVLSRLADGAAALELAAVPATDRERWLVGLAMAEARLGSKDALMALAQNAKGSDGAALVVAVTACADLRDAGLAELQSAPALGLLAARRLDAEQLSSLPRLYQQYRAEGGRDDRDFLDEVLARGGSGRNLDDLIDPFAPHGHVLAHHEPPIGPDVLVGQPQASGQGTVAGNSERGGSAPGVDDELAARVGGNVSAPPSGASGNHGKALGASKGNTNGNSGAHGGDPGEQ